MSADNNVIISVKDLKKYYNGGEVKALDGVTTDIKKGEVVVVIGPSGSGKSTFLRSLNLLERPTGGTITFDGSDIMSPSTDINIHIKLVLRILNYNEASGEHNSRYNSTECHIFLLFHQEQEASSG